MSETRFPFQPGVLLYLAVMGALRAKGSTFERWCRENDISATIMRYSLFGLARGKVGRQRLYDLIDSAGFEVVKSAYLARLDEHLAAIAAAAPAEAA